MVCMGETAGAVRSEIAGSTLLQLYIPLETDW
jgi:hypothetical protein